MVRRVLDLSLGLWLFVSAFLWPHGAAQLANATIVGVLLVAVALVRQTRQEHARHASTALAVWLFLANMLLPTSLPTTWNHALVAVLVFLVSLVPAHRGRTRVGGARAQRANPAAR
jgi:hypothetical protein